MPATKFIMFVYFWLGDTPHGKISQFLNLNSITVGDWNGFLNELMSLIVTKQFDDASGKIGGPGVIVEIDESKFGKRKSNKGHHVEGTWVFGGVERLYDDKGNAYAGRFFAVTVEDRKADTLLPILQQYVADGSIVFDNCWKGYCMIAELENGYGHSTVNHSKTYEARDGTHTNTIESCWHSKFKRHIGNRFYGNDEKLQGHLWIQVWKSAVKEDLWNEFWKALAQTGWHKNDELFVKVDEDAELEAYVLPVSLSSQRKY